MAAAVALGTLGAAAGLFLPGQHSPRTSHESPVQSSYVSPVNAHRGAPGAGSRTHLGRIMASAAKPWMF